MNARRVRRNSSRQSSPSVAFASQSELRLQLLEAIEQRQVAILGERCDRRPTRLLVLALERLDEPAELVGPVERLDLSPDVLEQDVEVAGRPERGAEPAELVAQLGGPVGVEQRPRGAQECARPPGRDPQLMEVLGVVAEARARIVREQALVLLRERGAEHFDGRCVRRRLGLFGRRELERAEDLRLEHALLRTGLEERLLEPFEARLVAVDQLDLELAEAGLHALTVEDRDRVVDDLRAVGEAALAARPQPRDAHELATAQVCDEQVEELRGRARGRPRHLELDPRCVARELELPEARAVLDPVAERDAARSEPQVGRVEVRRGERLRRQLRAERRELETLRPERASALARRSRAYSERRDSRRTEAAGRPPLFLTGIRGWVSLSRPSAT